MRPVFEPLINRSMLRDKLPVIHYPSRIERRHAMASKKYFHEMDMAAWFDQFSLPTPLRKYFVVKASDGSLYSLTRMPMGAAFSAAVAQVTLWCLLQTGVTDAKRVRRNVHR